MNKEKILSLLSEKGFGRYASWALYDVSDEQLEKESIKVKDVAFEIFKESLVDHINLNGMFLALNCAARDVMIEEWSNFHDIRSVSKDFKIPYMIKNTQYEGAYMTDLFKNLHITESDKFNVAIKKPENKYIYDSSIELFQYEYGLIKPKVIICFGGDVEKYLKKMIKLGQIKIDKDVKIIRLTHYAHYMSISDFKKQSQKLKN